MMIENIAAIIVAAGFSSRAKAFKPLLPMGESTMIQTVINTFRSIGIRNIVVVTGFNAQALEAHIAETGAICLRSDYLHNRMFDSACIGIRYLKDKCHMAFFTPVDVPLFTKFSLKEMISRMQSSACTALCPCYNDTKGHPLLINSLSFDDILLHDGQEGMKGAVNKLKGFATINLPDPALIMDADTPEAYAAMMLYERERSVPSYETCLKLHEFFKTPEIIFNHCKKVAFAAETMAISLIDGGSLLNLNKIRSAAFLHDIAGTAMNSASAGAALLEDLGHTGISSIVAASMQLDAYDTTHITEKSIVYLADKLLHKAFPLSFKDHQPPS